MDGTFEERSGRNINYLVGRELFALLKSLLRRQCQMPLITACVNLLIKAMECSASYAMKHLSKNIRGLPSLANGLSQDGIEIQFSAKAAVEFTLKSDWNPRISQAKTHIYPCHQVRSFKRKTKIRSLYEPKKDIHTRDFMISIVTKEKTYPWLSPSKTVWINAYTTCQFIFTA